MEKHVFLPPNLDNEDRDSAADRAWIQIQERVGSIFRRIGRWKVIMQHIEESGQPIFAVERERHLKSTLLAIGAELLELLEMQISFPRIGRDLLASTIQLEAVLLSASPLSSIGEDHDYVEFLQAGGYFEPALNAINPFVQLDNLDADVNNLVGTDWFAGSGVGPAYQDLAGQAVSPPLPSRAPGTGEAKDDKELEENDPEARMPEFQMLVLMQTLEVCRKDWEEGMAWPELPSCTDNDAKVVTFDFLYSVDRFAFKNVTSDTMYALMRQAGVLRLRRKKKVAIIRGLEVKLDNNELGDHLLVMISRHLTKPRKGRHFCNRSMADALETARVVQDCLETLPTWQLYSNVKLSDGRGEAIAASLQTALVEKFWGLTVEIAGYIRGENCGCPPHWMPDLLLMQSERLSRIRLMPLCRNLVPIFQSMAKIIDEAIMITENLSAEITGLKAEEEGEEVPELPFRNSLSKKQDRHRIMNAIDSDSTYDEPLVLDPEVEPAGHLFCHVVIPALPKERGEHIVPIMYTRRLGIGFKLP
ncbi:hypothetical protein HIM_03655 [Hirsutella minnesotensis 3608]|uniref:Uncharacterized protein n=1 Tax=Hirsutella minnesotensis 3608 TaxID=1043627 RepID=A0A0F7ZVK6_9HYPO|nr:hypothetical protein HIM_03655 [Hirsutella minnesotensis 3608]